MYIKYIKHNNFFWIILTPIFTVIEKRCLLAWFGDIQDVAILCKRHNLKSTNETDKNKSDYTISDLKEENDEPQKFGWSVYL